MKNKQFMLESKKVSIEYSPLKDIATIYVDDVRIAEVDYPSPNDLYHTHFCMYVVTLHNQNLLKNFDLAIDIRKQFDNITK